MPKGHYSHAAAGSGLLFISGQLPIAPDGSHPCPGFADQVRRAMGNLLTILHGAGSERSDLLKVTAYIVGIEHWDEFDAIYAELMGDARPARAVVPVPALHFGFKIEIDAVAVRAI